MLYFIICLLFSLMHRFQTGLEVNHLGLQKTTHFHYQIFIWHLSREMYVFWTMLTKWVSWVLFCIRICYVWKCYYKIFLYTVLVKARGALKRKGLLEPRRKAQAHAWLKWSAHFKKIFLKILKLLLMRNATIKWSNYHINWNKILYIIHMPYFCNFNTKIASQVILFFWIS